MDYIMKLFKTKNLKKLIKYTIAGILTTFVSYTIYGLLYYIIRIEPNISNVISIICSVIFAYVINKIFVFKSITINLKSLIIEVFEFVLARSLTIIIEICGVFLLVTLLKYDAMYSKILINIINVILNYIISSLFVFKQKLN